MQDTTIPAAEAAVELTPPAIAIFVQSHLAALKDTLPNDDAYTEAVDHFIQDLAHIAGDVMGFFYRNPLEVLELFVKIAHKAIADRAVLDAQEARPH